MKGYKAFDKNLKCKDMQYEVGETYRMTESPICCERGYHFCKNIADVYRFYPTSDDTKICEVVALGEVETYDNITYCTNEIKIIKEITDKGIKHCNLNNTDIGYCNIGDCNSGYCNSGSGNSGNWNSGNGNSGNGNSGDCNSGNWNCGVFNTIKKPTIKMFDKESTWTMRDWLYSDARNILSCAPYTYSNFILENDMSDEEKIIHPEYKTIGGYLKVSIGTKEDKQKWWDDLSEEDKEKIYNLPNFDADKFVKCFGIEHI